MIKMRLTLLILMTLYLTTVFAQNTKYDACVTKVKSEIDQLIEKSKENELILKNISIIQNIDFNYEIQPETSSMKVSVKFKDEDLAKKTVGFVSDFLLKKFSLNYPTQNTFYVALDDSCKYHVDNTHLQFCESGKIPTSFEETNIFDLSLFSGMIYLGESVKQIKNCQLELNRNILGNEDLLNPKDLSFLDKDGNNFDFLISSFEKKSFIDLRSAPYPLYLKYKNLTLLAKKQKCENDTYSLEPRIVGLKSSDDKKLYCNFKAIVNGKIVEIDSLDTILKKLSIEPISEASVYDDENNSCSSEIGRTLFCEFLYEVNGKSQSSECINSDNAKPPIIKPVSTSNTCSFEFENLDVGIHTVRYSVNEEEVEEKKHGVYHLRDGKMRSTIRVSVSNDVSHDYQTSECVINNKDLYTIHVKKYQDSVVRTCTFKIFKGDEEIPLKNIKKLEFKEDDMTCEKAKCKSDYLSRKISAVATLSVDIDGKIKTFENSECAFKALKIKGENEDKKKKTKGESSIKKNPDRLPRIEFPDMIPMPSMPIMIEY